MKNLYIILAVLIGGTTTLQAQSSAQKRGDKFYKDKYYVTAAKAYEKALTKGDRTQEVYTNLANSYYFISDYANAAKYYKEAAEEGAEPIIYYRLAQSQKAISDYDGAKGSMRKFATMMPNDPRAKMFMQNPDHVSEIKGMPEAYELKSIVLNTAASDFASVETNGKIYFSSSRNSSRNKYGRTKEPYLDIYQVAMTDGDTLGNPVLVPGDVNTKFHEGTLAVTPDDQYMFFTRVDYYDGDYEKAEDGESKLNIYRAMNAGGEWRDIKTTSLESEEYGVGHPSITADGKMIYFASEAPGGQGGTDIYKAELKNGVISNPVNLGDKVNTPGDDSFPFMAADGTLYFASNGHLGLGGLDVYKYKDGKVMNLGMPLNSPLDDFAFTIDAESGRGYVSSNREGGAGSDDIYRVQEIRMDTVDLNVTIIDDETGKPIQNAIVSVGIEDGEEIPAQTTGKDGKAMFTVNDMQEVQIYSNIAGYESGESSMELNNTRDMADITIRMRPEPKIVENKIILNKIYFDLDKSNIRPDAALELDRLVDLMEKNPELEVMAETYADIRGSDSYNQALTERRAQSIVDYVASQGIDKSRLEAVGRGESNPVVDCANKKCTKEEYELSRRSEFTVMEK